MQASLQQSRSRKLVSRAARILRNPELRQLVQSMRESANLGGDVYFANMLADLQSAMELVRRADRSLDKELTAVHVSKPRVNRDALVARAAKDEVKELSRRLRKMGG